VKKKKRHFPLRFRLLFSSDMKFDVEFTLNRYCLNLQHRAVDLAEKHKLEKVLFPTGAAVAYLSMPKLRSGGDAHKVQAYATPTHNVASSPNPTNQKHFEVCIWMVLVGLRNLFDWESHKSQIFPNIFH